MPRDVLRDMVLLTGWGYTVLFLHFCDLGVKNATRLLHLMAFLHKLIQWLGLLWNMRRFSSVCAISVITVPRDVLRDMVLLTGEKKVLDGIYLVVYNS